MAKLTLDKRCAHGILKTKPCRWCQYRIAVSAATDAANRQMRKEGRDVWSVEDYNLAARTINELLARDDIYNMC